MSVLLRVTGGWGIDHDTFKVLRLGARDAYGRLTLWLLWAWGIDHNTFRVWRLGARDAHGRPTWGYWGPGL